MNYGHVGRPTNEEVKKKKTKRILKITIPVVLVLVLGLVLTGKNGLSGMMGNSTGSDIQLGYHDKVEPVSNDPKHVSTFKQSDIVRAIEGDSVLLGKGFKEPTGKTLDYWRVFYKVTVNNQSMKRYLCYANNLKNKLTFEGANSTACISNGFYRQEPKTRFNDTAWSAIRGNATKIHLEPVWADSRTVKFVYANGTDADKTVKVKDGDSLTIPNAPTREGYKFKEWSSPQQPFLAGRSYKIRLDYVITAQWEKIEKFTVNFNYENGQGTKKEEVEKGAAVTAPAAPTKSGYRFKGWKNQTTGATWEPSIAYGPINRDMTLVAQWEKIEKVTVKFNFGNKRKTEIKTIEKGATVTTPAAPTMEGYKFKGWLDASNNDMLVGPSTAYGPINRSKTLSAKWVKVHEVWILYRKSASTSTGYVLKKEQWRRLIEDGATVNLTKKLREIKQNTKYQYKVGKNKTCKVNRFKLRNGEYVEGTYEVKKDLTFELTYTCN